MTPENTGMRSEKDGAFDLKMLLVALRAMDESMRIPTGKRGTSPSGTNAMLIMLVEASLKSLAALEARIAALEDHIKAQAFNMRP